MSDKLPEHKKVGWKGGYKVKCEEEGCEEVSTRRYTLDFCTYIYYCDKHAMWLP